jgi:hypothetical protein
MRLPAGKSGIDPMVAIAADLMANHARTNVSNAAICCDKYAPRGLGVLGKFKVLLDVAIGI